MRVFVGYGYNDRDKWIEQYVFPLLNAFGCDVLHGKAVYGGALSDEIMKTIRTADAMIGFTTKREPVAEGRYRTHEWVVQELSMAHTQSPRIPWVEVREEGVLSPGGILDSVDAQRIDYRQADLAACLVKIAEALRRLHDQANVTSIRLQPDGAVEQISQLLDDPSFTCTFQTLSGAVQSGVRKADVFPIKGGVFAQLRGVAREDLVRIAVSAKGRTRRSDYESVDTVDVQLRG